MFPSYLENAIGSLIDELARSTEDAHLTPLSFVFNNLNPDESAAVFDSLVIQGFINNIGILLPKTANFDALSFLFPLTPQSFSIMGGLITEEESSEVFSILISENLIIPNDDEPPTLGFLSSIYTPQTTLDFLFDGNPNAAAMRRQVNEIFDQVLDNINNTVGIIARARVLQISRANDGLAQFLNMTPQMIELLVPFASGASDVSNVLIDLLTPLVNDVVPAGVSEMISLLARANTLFVNLDFTLIQVEATVKGPQYFNISDTTQLDLKNLQSLTTFLGLVDDFQCVINILYINQNN